MLGALEIRGLRCTGRHGSSAERRAVQADFVVDLRVLTDLEPAARSDDLSNAVDLAALADTVRAVVGGPSCVLLETLVVRVGETLLARFAQLDEVRVRVNVPEPPGLNAAEEAIEVTLGRA